MVDKEYTKATAANDSNDGRIWKMQRLQRFVYYRA